MPGMLTFSKCILLYRAALTWQEGLPILHTVALSVNHCVAVQPYVDGTKRPVFFISLIFFISQPCFQAKTTNRFRTLLNRAALTSRESLPILHSPQCKMHGAKCTVQSARSNVHGVKSTTESPLCNVHNEMHGAPS